MGASDGIVGTVPDSELKLIRLCLGVSGRSPTQERARRMRLIPEAGLILRWG